MNIKYLFKKRMFYLFFSIIFIFIQCLFGALLFATKSYPTFFDYVYIALVEWPYGFIKYIFEMWAEHTALAALYGFAVCCFPVKWLLHPEKDNLCIPAYVSLFFVGPLSALIFYYIRYIARYIGYVL